MAKLKKYQKTILLYAIGALVMFFGGRLIDFHHRMDKAQILNGDYSFVEGEFERVGMVGVGSDLYVEVSYSVDDKTYTESVTSDYYYHLCNRNNRCDNKKFWVLYRTSDPSKALVDITKEIQNFENPPIPVDVENFK